MNQGTPILVLTNNTQRETGRKAQLANINAAKAIADVIMTTLGPKSMLKMLLDPMGGIVLSNDGHAILREIDINHPAGKSMLEISRTQDEEVGDGTTSVIILAGELMQASRPFIEQNTHPTVLVSAYKKALDLSLKILQDIAFKIDITSDEQMHHALNACIGTKFAARWSTLIVDMAVKSVRIISKTSQPNKLNVDLKRYARVEKIPGGTLDECMVMDGVMVNKDIIHPKMRRTIKNPRIVLLDCNLEYKKGESQTNLEMSKDTDMRNALQQEAEEVAAMCHAIMKWNPDVVVTEKGVSDLAQHYLLKQNISVIRRVRKTDNNRIARVTGATIVNRPEEIQESDIGTTCGLFEVRKLGDEYYTYFEECKNASACTIILRGASKDVLNEMERNFQDALAVVRNIHVNPKLVPGGGAIEMELAYRLNEKAKTIEGVEQLPFKAVASALEIIPRTLALNCGADVVRILTELRAKHAHQDGINYGIDGIKGCIADMKSLNILEPLSVKEQVLKSAIEASCMLLRIDDVVSGFSKKKKESQAGRVQNLEQDRQVANERSAQDNETFGDQRDG